MDHRAEKGIRVLEKGDAGADDAASTGPNSQAIRIRNIRHLWDWDLSLFVNKVIPYSLRIVSKIYSV